MNQYAYRPRQQYAIGACGPQYASADMVPYSYGGGYPNAMIAFGQDPGQPSVIDKTKAWLQTPSVAGLSRGALAAIGVAGATLLYGASSNWFGYGKGGRRHARRDY